jgi:MoaA/NifB/PqqE/SkfB family radical SAM enzyme
MVVEWTHRWLAATVGLLALATALAARRAGRARGPAWATVALVTVQGLVGREVVVRGLARDLVTLHLAMALAIVALATAVAVRAWDGTGRGEVGGTAARLVAVAAALTGATVLVGSAVHDRFVGGWPLVGDRLVPVGLTSPVVGLHTFHRALAAAGAAVTAWAAVSVRRHGRVGPLAGAALGGYAVNVGLGAAHVATEVRSAALVAAHLGVATATWTLLVAAALVARQRGPAGAELRDGSRVRAGAPAAGAPPDFAVAPLTVAWEITRACPLRCRHCRADAQTRRDRRELTTAEGIDLIGQVATTGARVLVITGGDPLARPDVYDLIAAGAGAGLHVGFSPSVTPRLTPTALARAVEAGAGTVHLSLDGASAATHDAFRGVVGSFARTIRMIEAAAELPVRLQVGTSVTAQTVGDLPAIAALLAGRVESWTLFFCVPTGRAARADVLDADGHERVLTWLATAPLPVPVRTVAAPAYRRVLIQCGRRPDGPAVNDGRGFCFVSHTGDVCPSGFLQVPVGNVRDRPLAHWYREHPLFVALRDPDRLGGRCGRCGFRFVCGGSRARAWAMSGDPLGEDPTCAFDPDGGVPPVASASPAG